MDTYTVRIGTRRAQTPARDLYQIPSRAAKDDGRIAGPWITTTASGWGWNGGPCPCGGIMQWAEAGYVPWHRICDRCGSHWDLHPVTLYIDRTERCAERVVVGYQLPNGRVVTSDDDIILAGYGEDDVPLVYEDRPARGPCVVAPQRHEYGEDEDHWQRVQAIYALAQAVPLTDDMITHGAIYGGWARRARFC